MTHLAAIGRRSLRWLTVLVTLLTVSILSVAATAPAALAVQSTRVVSGQVVVQSRQASAVEAAVFQVVPASVPVDDPSSGGGNPICKDNTQQSGSSLLTTNRWGDTASNLHTRLGSHWYNDTTQKMQRDGVDSSMLSFGNSLWATSINAVSMANSYCIASGVGTKIDLAAGKLAKLLWAGGGAGGITVVSLLFLAGLLAALMKVRSGGGHQLGRALVRPVLTLAAFLVMMNGALASTSTSYGTMSPGWLVSRSSAVIADVSGSLTADITTASLSGSLGTPNARSDAKTNRAHCLNYLANIRATYKAQNIGSEAQTAIPVAMDSMWQLAGLSSYVRTQYGTNNDYGWATFCRGLEVNSGALVQAPVIDAGLTDETEYGSVQMLLTGTGGPALPADGFVFISPSADWNSRAFAPTNNTAWDEMAVFWAACSTTNGKTWTVTPGWEKVTNSHSDKHNVDAQQCADFYNGKGSPDDMFFNWQDDAGAVAAGTKGVDAGQRGAGRNPADFLNTMHGTSGGSGSGAALVFAAFSIADLVVFGALAGIIFLLKTLLLATGLFVFVIALVDLIPGQSRASQLAKYAKSTLGFAIVAFGYNFLLAIMVMLSGFLLDIGTAMGLAGLSQVIWTTAAPLVSIIAMKFLWKRATGGAPDPFSVKGLKGYASGAATGVIGGGAGGVLRGAMNRGRSVMSSRGTDVGSRSPLPAGVGGIGTGGVDNSAAAGSARTGGQDPVQAAADEKLAAIKAAGGSVPDAAGAAGAAATATAAGAPTGRGTGRAARKAALVAGRGGDYDHSKVAQRFDGKAGRQARRDALRDGAAQRRQWYGGHDESDAQFGGVNKARNQAVMARRKALGAVGDHKLAAVGVTAAGAAAVTAMPALAAVGAIVGGAALVNKVSGKGRAQSAQRRARDRDEKMAFFVSAQKQAGERSRALEAQKAAEAAAASAGGVTEGLDPLTKPGVDAAPVSGDPGARPISGPSVDGADVDGAVVPTFEQWSESNPQGTASEYDDFLRDQGVSPVTKDEISNSGSGSGAINESPEIAADGTAAAGSAAVAGAAAAGVATIAPVGRDRLAKTGESVPEMEQTHLPATAQAGPSAEVSHEQLQEVADTAPAVDGQPEVTAPAAGGGGEAAQSVPAQSSVQPVTPVGGRPRTDDDVPTGSQEADRPTRVEVPARPEQVVQSEPEPSVQQESVPVEPQQAEETSQQPTVEPERAEEPRSVQPQARPAPQEQQVEQPQPAPTTQRAQPAAQRPDTEPRQQAEAPSRPEKSAAPAQDQSPRTDRFSPRERLPRVGESTDIPGTRAEARRRRQ